VDAEDAVEDEAAFRARLRIQEGDWFVIHSYAGYENRVKANLQTRVTSLNMEPYIFDVQVPMETVTEIKNGQRKLVNRVRMPGYVLVRMDLTDESWGAVRHTPGVTGSWVTPTSRSRCPTTRSTRCSTRASRLPAPPRASPVGQG